MSDDATGDWLRCSDQTNGNAPEDYPSVYDQVSEYLSEWNPEALLADGMEDALVGTATRPGSETVALYDRAKCVALLVAQGMTDDEAEEFFEYNVAGAWVGPGTPVFAWLPTAGVRSPEEA